MNELLCTLIRTPDILAVTETKLDENSTVNIEIPGYNFFHTDSNSAAGGAGIYVSNSYNAHVRPDLKLNLDLAESCWIEVDPGIKHKNPIVIGCIYRHPNRI